MFRVLRLLTISLALTVAIPAYCDRLPHGYLRGTITLVSEKPIITLADGTVIDVSTLPPVSGPAPTDCFFKLLDHWREHPGIATFAYKLGKIDATGMQHITIIYHTSSKELWGLVYTMKGAYTPPRQE